MILAATVDEALPIILMEQRELLISPIQPIDWNMDSNSSLNKSRAMTLRTEEHLSLYNPKNTTKQIKSKTLIEKEGTK